MNRETYEDPEVADHFEKAAFFFHSEQLLLDELNDRLPGMDMLDVGVGGGRTTPHFAPLCRSYIGIDYAQAMVDICKRRFGERWPFYQADACDMSQFKARSFDFVFFSFNGIDYVPHHDRRRILAEIYRISRPGAVFAFSTHNLDFAHSIFKWKRAGGLLRDIARHAFLLASNAGYLLTRPKDHARLNDGAHHFGLRTYYISPQSQVAELETVGFEDIRVVSQDGEPGAGRQPTFICRRP